MSSDTIVGISFGDAYRAHEFMLATQRLVAHHHVELLDAVTIAKDADGKTHVRETVDPSPASSALSGGLWAGLLGLILAGPVGWVAGTAVGAGVGAVTAKVVDVGIPDDWVAWFKEAVQPGTVTVVLLLRQVDRPAVLAELERFAGARLVYANVDADAIQRMRDALGDPATGPLTQQPAGPPAKGSGPGEDGTWPPPTVATDEPAPDPADPAGPTSHEGER